MNLIVFFVFGVFLLAFSSISRRIHGTPLTAPIAFVAFGVLIGGYGLGLFISDFQSEVFQVVAEVTLILVLFSDASRIDLRSLLREQDLPIRLLTIGLALTLAAGTGIALLLFTEMSIWEAAILAAILTPTDAALAQSVVSSPLLPVRLRQALNVESGLNDGVALPLLILFMVLSGHFSGHQQGSLALFAVGQIALGPIVGVAVGLGGGKLLLWCHRRGWVDHAFLSLSALALAVVAFAGAELVGGNGFIAAFAAGFTVGNGARAVCMTLYDFAEAEGQLLMLFTFVVFGAAMIPAAGALGFDWRVVLYAAASLTVVRMVPAVLSLLGTGLMWESHVILGWFGPRGIASIIYLLIVVGEATLPAYSTILAVTVTTIVMSVVLHGVTAGPMTRWYQRRIDTMMEGGMEMDDMPEMMPVTEMRTRKAM